MSKHKTPMLPLATRLHVAADAQACPITAALLREAATSAQVNIPQSPFEIRAFIGPHFSGLEFGNPGDQEPHENDRWSLTSHDLAQAFARWFDVEAQQQPEQAQKTEVKPWEFAILEDYPHGQKEYWPDVLKIKYMSAEIDDLRKIVAADTPQQPEPRCKAAVDLITLLTDKVNKLEAEVGLLEKERTTLQRATVSLQKEVGQLKAEPKPEQPAQQQSATAGMNIAQRILHVGGRNNAAGYIEFGSVQAVEALVRQFMRDLPDIA